MHCLQTSIGMSTMNEMLFEKQKIRLYRECMTCW